jgi:hypothetical protein
VEDDEWMMEWWLINGWKMDGWMDGLGMNDG